MQRNRIVVLTLPLYSLIAGPTGQLTVAEIIFSGTLVLDELLNEVFK